ncbi:MAG: tagaturonate epimerase, partial [Abditibacteriota bacterium]|nr:tagaturonate epimerase [Abditibacteriota bacterium]
MNGEQFQELLGGAQLYAQSVQHVGNETFGFARDGTQHYLVIAYDPRTPAMTRDNFSGEVQDLDEATALKWCLPSRGNARKLRALFAWTAPQPIGLKRSFGAGDRLGLAAPAHIRAARNCGGENFALILAQQSIREMTRTQREAEDVLDAATWGAFQENFRAAWGADADHLKTEADVRRLAATGFTFFTIDPSEHVDVQADALQLDELERRFLLLPDGDALSQRYAGRSFVFALPDQLDKPLRITFDRATFLRAAIKYARAVSHTVALAKVLCEVKGEGNFDLEMSVDETPHATSAAEHFFVANELKGHGVRVHSLAIRFVGEFQKGIDYIGDIDEFRARLKEHVLIAKQLGPYKISVHSGSDKFAVFPILAQECGELIHEKTAGTWYLEALRVAARREPQLFRHIADFARERFPTERATYHVVENLDGV